MLSSVRGFLEWLIDTEPGAELAEGSALLTADRIAEYRVAEEGLGGRPKGSADAITSFLTRVAFGGVGLTPAPAGEEVAVEAADPVADALGLAAGEGGAGTEVEAPEASADGLGHQVGAVLATYVPTTLSAARWDRIAVFTRAAVARAAPLSAQAARDAVRSVAYLAAWVDAAQRPVRVDVVFDPATVAAYVTVLADRMDTPTAAHHRTNVVRVAAAALPGADFSGLPSLARKKPQPPATPAQVEAAQRWALNRRSAKTTRYATAVVLLAAGCGLNSVDAGWATPTDVVAIGAGLGVDVRRPGADGVVTLRRTSFVLPAYADQVRQLAADATAAGDAFLLGGGGVRPRRVETLLRVHGGDIDVMALRYQWMLEILDGGLLPIETFLAAAGLETLRVVEDLLGSRYTPAAALEPLMHTGGAS